MLLLGLGGRSWGGGGGGSFASVILRYVKLKYADRKGIEIGSDF